MRTGRGGSAVTPDASGRHLEAGRSRLVPMVAALAAAGGPAALLFGMPGPWRVALLVGALLVAPAVASARAANLPDPVMAVAVGVASSLSLLVLNASGLLYLGMSSPLTVTCVSGAVTLATLLLALQRRAGP